MGKVGIMTFHAAHNYGSVLQAYATQKTIEELGYQSEIINYRLNNQRQFYNNLYPRIFGTKILFQSLLKLPEHFKAKKRSDRFESFISHRLILSQNEYTTFEDLSALDNKYEVLMSGSDQVWNEHCTAEFKTEPAESILGYYLAFGSDKTRRIAYSSSFGGMKSNEILKYKKYLERYEYLSCREITGANMLSLMLGREVKNTLDPTLVLNKDDWNIEGVYDINETYIFVYTLRRYHTVQAMLREVKNFAKRKGLKIKCVAPFSPVHIPGIEALPDCGPLDFLSYIKSAEVVITDSFHGTAFAINFGIPFYTVQIGDDKRIALLLEQLEIQNRIIKSPEELIKVDDYSHDYTEAWRILKVKRMETIMYLRDALEGTVK